MGNMNTILQNYRDTIAANSALATWCTTNFSDTCTVYVGDDIKDPHADESPMVVIWPLKKKTGTDEQEILHVFVVSCSIIKDSLTTTSNKKEYAGVQLLESFRKLVENAMTGMTDANRGGRIVSLDIDYDVVVGYPQMVCYMTVATGTPLEFGDDIFA